MLEKVLGGVVAKIVPVEEEFPAGRIVKAHDQVDQGALAGSALPGQADLFPFGDFQRDVLQDLLVAVGKTDVFNPDPLPEAAQGPGMNRFKDGGFLCKEFLQSPNAHAGQLQGKVKIGHPLDGNGGEQEGGEEGDKVSRFGGGGEDKDQKEADPQHRENLDHRIEEVAGLGRLDVHDHTPVGLFLEGAELLAFHRVGLDDPDGGKRFQEAAGLGDGELGEAFGQLAEAATAFDHRNQHQGKHADGDQGQLPVDDQHAGENRQEGEGLPQGVHEAVGHGEVNRGSVSGDTAIDVGDGELLEVGNG